MRVIHIIGGLEIGGAELFLARLVSSTDWSGVQHKVISLTDIGALGSEIGAHGVDVECIGIIGLRNVIPGLFKLYKSIRNWRPNVIQTWMYHADLIGGILGFVYGKSSVVWNVRATRITNPTISQRLVRYFCGLLSRGIPDAVIYASDSAMRWHRKYGYSCKNEVVVHNGFYVGPNKYRCDEEIRGRLGINGNDFVIGSVGRHCDDKGYGFLRDVVEKLGIKAGGSIKLICVGAGNSYENEVFQGLFPRSDFEGRVIPLGLQRDMDSIYASFDLFFLHSVTEAFPNVLGEAMVRALPCISTDVGDAAQILGEYAYVGDYGDVDFFVDRIQMFMAMGTSSRSEVGLNNRRRIESEFSIGYPVEKMKNLYKDLVS